MPKLRVNNIELSYHKIGKGPPIVFVAGLGMDHMSWLYQIPSFHDHYTCLLVDNRGIGQSTGSDDAYSISLMANDIVSLLKKLDYQKIHLVGHSMGGMISQEFAIQYPQMVETLVLSSTFAKHPEMITFLQEALRNKFQKTLFNKNNQIRPEFFSFKSLHAFLLQHVFCKEYLEKNESIITSVLQRYLKQDTFIETFLKQLHAIYKHDTLDRLNKIEAKTFIFSGDNDPLVPVSCARILHENIPNSKFHLEPGATHSFHIEHPDKFNTLIDSFLTNNSEL